MITPGQDATTVVPADFFDDVLAALDQPSRPAPALADAMRRARDLVCAD